MSTLTPPAPPPAPDRASFRALLETQRADCVRQRELALAGAVTAVPDPVAVDRAAGLLPTIGEIDAALDRTTAGTYGVCTACGGDLPAERLASRPFAATGVSCRPQR